MEIGCSEKKKAETKKKKREWRLKRTKNVGGEADER
jgi:hypothetical protein